MTQLNTKLSGRVQVFVYGTLKPGEGNYQRYCAGKIIAAEKATTQGQLFALPMGYPAMTMGKDIVHGYLLSFADVEVLKTLDELEDYQPDRQMSENLYNRQQVKIYHPQDLFLGWAWTYLMNPTKIQMLGGNLLPDGCWSS